MLEPNFFNQIFVYPIVNILVILYKGLTFLKIPGAVGWAIIGLTIIIRLILHPFFKSQMETAKKVQQIKPHLDHLSKKHKDDKKKLQEEQLKLYQKYGINPASGCLFMIIQFPIFIGLYQTLSLFLMNKETDLLINQINRILIHPIFKISEINPWFFGFNLAVSPATSNQWLYWLIPLITAFLQYYQTQFSIPTFQTEQKEEAKVKKEETKKNENHQEDFQKAMNIQMKFLLPAMIGYFSYTLPVGLSLYWNVFSIFSIIYYRQVDNKNNGKNFSDQK